MITTEKIKKIKLPLSMEWHTFITFSSPVNLLILAFPNGLGGSRTKSTGENELNLFQEIVKTEEKKSEKILP